MFEIQTLPIATFTRNIITSFRLSPSFVNRDSFSVFDIEKESTVFFVSTILPESMSKKAGACNIRNVGFTPVALH